MAACLGGLYINQATILANDAANVQKFAHLNWRFDRQDAKLNKHSSAIQRLENTMTDMKHTMTDMKHTMTDMKHEIRMCFLAALALLIVQHISRRP